MIPQVLHLEIHIDTPEAAAKLAPLLQFANPKLDQMGYTIKQLELITGYSRPTLYTNYINTGKLTPKRKRPRGQLYFDPKQVDLVFKLQGKKKRQTII